MCVQSFFSLFVIKSCPFLILIFMIFIFQHLPFPCKINSNIIKCHNICNITNKPNCGYPLSVHFPRKKQEAFDCTFICWFGLSWPASMYKLSSGQSGCEYCFFLFMTYTLGIKPQTGWIIFHHGLQMKWGQQLVGWSWPSTGPRAYGLLCDLPDSLFAVHQ